jgi:hypothetical protein
MAKKKTPDFDEHGRGRNHPAHGQPIVGHADHPGGTGVVNGAVVPDRQRLGLGGSGGWLDEQELPISYRPTAGDVEPGKGK